MGWIKLLADLGLGVAAPFTGGASLAAIPIANAALDRIQGNGPNSTPPSDSASSGGGGTDYGALLSGVGSTLGAQQAGKAQGALAQAGAQQQQDRNAISLYGTAQGAQNQAAQTDLERQQFAANNRGQTAQQAMVGALLGGYKPLNTRAGLGADLVNNPNALKAAATLNSQAGTAQNTPLSFTGGNILASPALTPLPDLGKSNSFASTLANLLQLAGAGYSGYQKIKTSQDG
jgi:hypothetical protein